MTNFFLRLLDSEDTTADSIVFLGLLAAIIMIGLFLYTTLMSPTTVNWTGFGEAFTMLLVGIGGGKGARDGWHQPSSREDDNQITPN